ncbi:type II secretion system protein [Aquincola sp. MAHUQ-54]|uniref:Type II secretion system protein n=1 Tax=Aquincola agrisoli TaxID=3119538 RepID=A0AAW9QB82_9BURK
MSRFHGARQRGFTIVELVVTVAILGVLATGALPLAELVIQRQKEQELRLALREIRGAIDAYKRAVDEGRVNRAADATGFPESLDALAVGTRDMRSTEKQMIYFLRRVPRDPFEPDASLPAAATWGLRSYASPPEDPQPGKDVFDVYSRAPGTGLNGQPYRAW